MGRTAKIIRSVCFMTIHLTTPCSSLKKLQHFANTNTAANANPKVNAATNADVRGSVTALSGPFYNRANTTIGLHLSSLVMRLVT